MEPAAGSGPAAKAGAGTKAGAAEAGTARRGRGRRAARAPGRTAHAVPEHIVAEAAAATAARGARAAGTHQVGDEPDDQQHRHDQQDKAHTIRLSFCRSAVAGVAAVQRHAVDAAQPVGQRLHGFLRAGVIITVDPVRFHVLVQQRPQRAERQLAFQPVAAHDVVVAAVGLVGGQQQQHAVVQVVGAQPPGVKNVVGKALHRRVAQQFIQRVDADLRTAGIGQLD